jgi:hypothetical protein
MVLVKGTDDSEKGVRPTTEALEAMGRYNQQLVNAGIMLVADGLKPSAPIPCRDRARSKSGRCTRWLICGVSLTPNVSEIHERTRSK